MKQIIQLIYLYLMLWMLCGLFIFTQLLLPFEILIFRTYALLGYKQLKAREEDDTN